MDVYFMRHGQAASSDEWTGDDRSRPLVAHGENVVTRVARRLAEVGVRPDIVITSPYLRALQTATIAVQTMGVGSSPRQDERLVPGFDLAAFREMLEEVSGARSLMLVGHESDFSVVIGQVIGGGRVVMKKAGVALVEIPDPSKPSGRLVWLLAPALLPG